MQLSELNWNPNCAFIWSNSKLDLWARIRAFKWIPQAGGVTPLPFHIGRDIQSYVDRAGVTGIREVAYDNTLPGNFLYGLRVDYTNGTGVILLHSNMRVVNCIATYFKPSSKIKIVRNLKVN